MQVPRHDATGNASDRATAHRVARTARLAAPVPESDEAFGSAFVHHPLVACMHELGREAFGVLTPVGDPVHLERELVLLAPLVGHEVGAGLAVAEDEVDPVLSLVVFEVRSRIATAPNLNAPLVRLGDELVQELTLEPRAVGPLARARHEHARRWHSLRPRHLPRRALLASIARSWRMAFFLVVGLLSCLPLFDVTTNFDPFFLITVCPPFARTRPGVLRQPHIPHAMGACSETPPCPGQCCR